MIKDEFAVVCVVNDPKLILDISVAFFVICVWRFNISFVSFVVKLFIKVVLLLILFLLVVICVWRFDISVDSCVVKFVIAVVLLWIEFCSAVNWVDDKMNGKNLKAPAQKP